ncbi:hypothetical protein AAVH_11444 [Aphelenchoides avenae]|nr:hypothetical protein AAVH_11444 [Aphelenchus avenae]
MLNAIKPILLKWTMPPPTDTANWDAIREHYGPLALEIADDTPESFSFWKWWAITIGHELKSFYRFLEQNDFTWPVGGVVFEDIGPTKGEVPYVRPKIKITI